MKTLQTSCRFVIALGLLSPVRAELLATAELRANLAPVTAAPDAPGRLALIGGAIEASREEGPPLVVDAGNAFQGRSQSLNSRELVAEAFALMNYDALNITPADLADDPEGFLRLVQTHALPALAANLVQAENGAPLLPAFVRLSRADREILIVGLSGEIPESALRMISPGIRMTSATEALRRALEDAEPADRVVVLFHGTPMAAMQAISPVRDRVHAVVLNGQGRATNLGGVPLLFAGENGTQIGRLRFDGTPVDALRITADTPVHAELRERMNARLREETAASDARRAALNPGPPREMPPVGETVRLLSKDAHQGMGLTVFNWRLASEFGEQAPRSGHAFLIIEASVENRVRPRLSQGLEYPAAVQVATLENKLFLSHNRRRFIRHRPEHLDLPGHLPNQFRLMEPGRAAEGLFVFEIPREDTRDLSLLLYHDEFPALNVPLLLDPAPAEAPAPLVTAENEVVRLEIHGVRREAVPNDGAVRFFVDLRGQSRMTRMADSAALDASVAIEDNTSVPHAIPAEYDYFSELVFLGIGDEHTLAFQPELSEFPGKPAFPPDRSLGGLLVFDVPETYADHALSLRAWFPAMAIAGERGRAAPVTPESITLPMQEGPRIPLSDPMVALSDGDMELHILEAEALDVFHGQAPPDNRQWIRLLLRIENNGNTSGLMPMEGRFGLTHAGQRTPHDLRAAGAGPFAPGDRLYLPAGEARVVETVIASPTDLHQLQFDYRGITVNPQVEIDLAQRTGLVTESEDSDPETAPLTAATPEEGAIAQAGPVHETSEIPDLPLPDFTAETLPMDTDAHPLQHPVDVGVRGQNDRIELEISRAHLFNNIHGVAVEEGKVILGLDLRIQRRDDPANPDAPEIDGDVAVRRLQDFVWAVRGFGRLHEMHRIRGCPLQISERFNLRHPGQAETGFLYFEIDPEALRHFELHWLDPEHGNITLPVFPLGEGFVDTPPPLHAGENDIAAFEIHGLQTRETFLERSPRSEEWLALDLRGRSLRESAPENPEASTHGMMLHWRDWAKRAHLILNGDQVYFLHSWSSNQPESWPMLPTRGIGAEIAFDLPKGAYQNAESAELVLGFAPHAFPGQRVRAPEPVRIMLKGERIVPEIPEDVMAKFEDFDMDLVFHGFSEPEQIEGSNRSGPWLRASFTATATTDEGVMIAPNEILHLLTAQRRPLNPRMITWGGMTVPDYRDSRQWIPPGDARTFHMAFQIGEHQAQDMRIRYSGMKFYESIPLGTPGAPDPDAPRINPEENNVISERGVKVLSPELEPKGIAGVGLAPEEVNGAIDRGRDFLWEQLRPEIERRGVLRGRRYTIISLYALVNTNAHREYPLFDEALREFLHWVNPNDLGIYENGLLAMILRAYGDPGLYDKLEQVTRYLVEAQGENGTWSYTANVPDHFFPRAEPEEKKDTGPFEIVGGGPPPEENAKENVDGPMYRTQSFTLGSEGDNSCTQFGVLGLWSAQRAGIVVDRDVWLRNLRSAASFQNLAPNDHFGGYAYRASGGSYGSMTAAVLCTTAIALRQLDTEVNIAQHLRIRNALGWLVENFSVNDNPSSGRYNYYFLYSLERVGQILGTEFFGEHEWYPLGARYLVDRQSENGSWPTGPGEGNPLLTTSYALLFLVRATPQMDEEIVPEPEPEGPGSLVTNFTRAPPPPRLYLIFDASGSMRAPIDGKMKFDIARDAVRDLVETLPEGTEFALRVYGHRHRANLEEAVTDSALELPFRPIDKELVNQTLDRLRPVGRTPLAYSLDEALRDIGRGRGETLVLLLTDGGDDTRSNPVESARAYANLEHVQFHVLGFDINRPNWTLQLEQMAEASGGRYHPVAEAADLTRDLKYMVSPPPPAFEILDTNGELVTQSQFGGNDIELEPGEYRLKTKLADREMETTFWIRPGSATRLTFDWEQAARVTNFE